MKDQEESYIRNRNLVEYLASFIEPELVSEIMKKRDQSGFTSDNVSNEESDAIFNESIKQIFGRDPNLAPKDELGGDADQIGNTLDRIATYEHEKDTKNTNPAYNYRHWADFDLE